MADGCGTLSLRSLSVRPTLGFGRGSRAEQRAGAVSRYRTSFLGPLGLLYNIGSCFNHGNCKTRWAAPSFSSLCSLRRIKPLLATPAILWIPLLHPHNKQVRFKLGSANSGIDESKQQERFRWRAARNGALFRIREHVVLQRSHRRNCGLQ